jgi:hypothetical protein
VEITKEQIIALAGQYPISLNGCEEALNKCIAPYELNNHLDECGNHLDTDFMDALKKGIHLDVSVVPLHA